MTERRPAATAEIAAMGERLWITSPAPRDVWAELLADDPHSLVTQSPGWLDARCRLGGYEDASRLYRRQDGRLLVLPMVRRRVSEGALALQSSFGEGWGMGGLIATGGVSRADVDVVTTDLSAAPALRTVIRPNPLLAAEWMAAARPSVRAVARLSHVLDLEGGFERIWDERFTQLARRNVRKAEKAGIVVERGSSEKHLAAFEALWNRSLERWASRQHEPLWLSRIRLRGQDPPRKFRLLASTLGDAFGVWLASLDGRPVAGAIVLRGANAHYTRGGMDAEVAGPTRANYLLHAAAIRDACDAGCRHYHMGETGGSRSLAFFKTRFGADAYPHAEYRFERLPFTPLELRLRAAVKRVIGFVEDE
jgi:Acetyltransferase (GNAT) domain